MQDIDLNIYLNCFGKSGEKQIVNAICGLIKNEWWTLKPFNSNNNISFEYDSRNQTLKITNNHWMLKPSDFVITTFLSDEFNDLLSSIICLMANNYHLQFKNKFGTFTPYINQKEDLKTVIPTVHLHYNEADLIDDKWNNLKDCFNNQDSKTQNPTIITISPVSQQLVCLLKKHLSWVQNWQEVICSKKNYLLVNKPNKPNKIYLDGISVELYQDIKPGLLYSYDINSSFMHDVHRNENDDWYTQRILYIILNNLSKEDKKRIYPTIFNNNNCLEWTYPQIQEMIVTFMNKQNPGQYVICAQGDNPANDVITLIKQANKIIIEVNDEIFDNLNNEIPDIYTCMQQLLAEKYNQPGLSIDDLSLSEQSNFQLLKEFLVYFAHWFAPYRKWLTLHDVTQLSIEIVENLPGKKATYSQKLAKGIIDRSCLHDAKQTFSAGMIMMWRCCGVDYKYWEFDELWLKNTVGFFTNLKCNRDDEATLLAKNKSNNN